MKTCKETSVLVTRSLDRRLTVRERFGMRLHLLVCANCRRFVRQMQLLRAWLHDGEETPSAGLSQQARERIAKGLRGEE